MRPQQKRRSRVKSLLAVPAVVAVLSASQPVGAELNVPIAARVVSFLLPAPTGPVNTAIIFAPGNPASLADAAAIERAVGSAKATVRTRRVPVGALDSLSGYRVAFVTAGLRGEQDDIAAAATRASVVTITSDQACVQAARCVVGIGNGPRVQITVSRAAARSVGAKFGSAFLMLVKEI
ncbi:MAG: hypothetical protein DI544_13135 [Sphingomonas taxi]|uniref:DUF4154 domain-containing protein n=1 Tax=Sphingomonas taxi TaxID=1549858 RepID=A0A2W5QV88_9SPHN|nr:MAG: hypothetical protein DI544_13135 [Sphingomonas taxi]